MELETISSSSSLDSLGYSESMEAEAVCCLSEESLEPLSLKEKLYRLRVAKPPHWQEMSVKLIRGARLESSSEEIKRLRELDVLDATVEKKLDAAISCFSYEKREKVKTMMGRALEIQKIYQKTHHVFVHAQGSSWLVVPDLIKEALKVTSPEKDLHQFKCLRIPRETPPDATISKYKTSATWDHETQAREDLISADGYFFNSGCGESALYFMHGNWSVCGSKESVIRSLVAKLFPKLSSGKVNEFASRLIMKTSGDDSSVGNLFVFCIPKEGSEKIQYRAHPYGKVCSCHPSSEDCEILDSLQRGELDSGSKCGDSGWGSSYSCPQYRLFTPELRTENGVKSYLISSNPTYRKKVKEGVRELVHEMAALEGLAIPDAPKKSSFDVMIPDIEGMVDEEAMALEDVESLSLAAKCGVLALGLLAVLGTGYAFAKGKISLDGGEMVPAAG